MEKSGGGGAKERKRGVEGGNQKEAMTTQRAWDWDLHEMRAAAKMDDPLLDETLDELDSAPNVAVFTPINNHGGHSNTAPIASEHDNAAVKSTAADKPSAPKRRKIQPPATTTAPKPKKAASSKKARRAKTAAQLDCQDISKGLSRTKSTASQDKALSAKARLSFVGMPSEKNQDQQRVGDISIEFDVKSALSGLGDKYAYPNFMGNVVNHASPSTLPTPANSDKVKADLCQNDQSRDQDPATERQACPDTYIERPIQENPKCDGSIIIRDFGAPPFTQTSPPTLQEPSSAKTMMADKFEPLDSVSNEFLGVGDIKYGRDDFPIDDECLEEMMQSTVVGVEEDPLCLEWPPQESSDATIYTDEQPRGDLSHWSENFPHSDREVIYDEGPSLVLDDDVDVLSSPTWSSQASCILTHVTGNAEPNRARTSEGSENCFDDHDLDDGLIDLPVDESNSLQSTSPVTPAKPPLSPKLQWLPPKTYTPAKSSQVPVSLTDDPHLVPVKFSGNALPFIRPPFPKAIRDRSPILGLSNRTVLRTCFRIGEALNAAAVGSRTNVDAIVELYARVVTSSREASGGYKQFFQFGDLFTDKPPYLNGTYTFWKGVNLWDNDSNNFVGEQGKGKMARVLGRIKRKEPVQGQGPGVEMAVLSVWEVDWEDVGTAKGIVCAK